VSLLTIAQDLADEIGIDRPASVVSSTDNQVRQLHAILKAEGEWLVSGAGYGHQWAACLRDKSVTVTSGTDVYAMPTDCLYIVNDTLWDTTNDWRMIGPLSSQEWETIKRGTTITGPRKRWRIIGEADGTYAAAATSKYVQIDPVPTNSTDTFFYEYFSTGYARQNSDAAAGSWDHDSDNPILPERLFKLGAKYRWLRAKGLPYDEEKAEYDRYLETCIGIDKGSRKLSLARRNAGPHLLDWHNIPDTGYGV
jgi:hypothetical protein